MRPLENDTISINRDKTYPTLMTDVVSLLAPGFAEYVIRIMLALRKTYPDGVLTVAIPPRTPPDIRDRIGEFARLVVFHQDEAFLRICRDHNTLLTADATILKHQAKLWDKQIYIPESLKDSIDGPTWKMLNDHNHKIITLKPTEVQKDT